jgi:hypothetical protein
MKFRIIGTLLVLVVLAALGFASGVFDNKPTTPQVQPTNPSDADLKGLKIN